MINIKLNIFDTLRSHISMCACIVLLCVSVTVNAQNQRSDLQDIQQLIEQTKTQLSKNLATIERLQQELKLAELEIAKTSVQLNKTKTDLSNTVEEISVLGKRQKHLQTQVRDQQNLLGKQIKSAYLAGDYDYAKMLFNQEQANKLERVLVYYKYLNNARQTKIDGFRALIAELKTVVSQLDQKKVQLVQLQDLQVEQYTKLSSQQEDRLVNVANLNRMIENDQSRVTRLQQQERDLLRAIEQAELAATKLRQQQSSIRNLSGLNDKQGQLAMPASGRMRALFGKRRQGQVNWKGVMFNSPSGSPVQSVADGKVLYADWLKGFGLVIIVDHGAGYMSVYGHNQALLKSVGDYVGRGESISLVGASGGQGNSGLYFELRHKGKALNPSNWLRRS